MKAIIVGCGRQGALLAEMLEEEEIEVTVIDMNPKSFARLENFKGKKILGNGTREKILENAGIKNCDAFAAVTNNDNINLMAAQIARSIFQVPWVVCRIYDPRRATVYSELGLDTVNFSRSGAHLLKSSIIGAGTVKRMHLGDGSGMAIEFPVGLAVNGKTISDLEIPGQFRISSIIRGLKVLIATPDLVIKTDDRIFGITLTDQINVVLKKLSVGEIEGEA